MIGIKSLISEDFKAIGCVNEFCVYRVYIKKYVMYKNMRGEKGGVWFFKKATGLQLNAL